MNRGFASIGLLTALIAVVVIGGGGYWFLTQSNAPILEVPTSKESFSTNQAPAKTSAPIQPTTTSGTSAQKTYRNEKFGFEISYLPEYTLTASPNTSAASYVEVFFDKPNFRFKFFAGTAERGGYLLGHEGVIWEKTIVVGGESRQEVLVKCGGGTIALSISAKFVPDSRFDRFASDCFHASLTESFVPQMEALAKTLHYSESAKNTFISADGYTFTYDSSLVASDSVSTEFSPESGLKPSATVAGSGGYGQKVELLTYSGTIDSAQEAFISDYRKYYSPQIIKVEDVSINGNSARIVTYKVTPSYPEAKIYLISYKPNAERTIVAIGDYSVIATIKTQYVDPNFILH